MSDPRETPDFYGYGADIEVALDTGRCRMRVRLPRVGWRDVVCVFRLVLWLPWVVTHLWRCWFGLERPWRGQVETEKRY